METLESSQLSRQRFKTKYISAKDSRDCDTKLDTIGFDSIVYSSARHNKLGLVKKRCRGWKGDAFGGFWASLIENTEHYPTFKNGENYLRKIKIPRK